MWLLQMASKPDTRQGVSEDTRPQEVNCDPILSGLENSYKGVESTRTLALRGGL